MKKYLSILFLSILFITPFYVAQDFFASPESCGFISFDILFLLSLILLPPGKIWSRVPFFVGVLIYLFCGNTIVSYATGLFYALLILSSIVLKSKASKLVFSVVFCLALTIFSAENFFFSTYSMDLANIWSAASFYWWGIFLFFAVPLAITGINVFFQYRFLLIREKKYSAVGLVIFISLILAASWGSSYLQNRQPILEFSASRFFWKNCTPGIISQSSLLNKNTQDHFQIWNNQRSIFDFNRPTVYVLVESWGVNQDVSYADSIISGKERFNNIAFSGIYQRTSSFTQGAEWEDFEKNDLNQNFTANKFKENGFETWYIHGYDGDFYNRESSYNELGFDTLRFKTDFENLELDKCKFGFSGICDSSIIKWLDELLSRENKKFIYWTTLDAHPPYEGQVLEKEPEVCKNLTLSKTECIYYDRQVHTLDKIKELAKKHPEYQFILRGDHRPMGSMEESGFVASFYYKWVPLVILN